MLEVNQAGLDTDLTVWVNMTPVWTCLVLDTLMMKITTSRMVVAIIITLLPNMTTAMGPMQSPYFMDMKTIRVPTSLNDITDDGTSRKQA